LSISISSTGQYQTAVFESGGGGFFTSTDFGVTWVQRSTATKTNAFTRIKSSASGQYQLATSGPVGNVNGQLYVSSDYGQTWIPRRGLATWLGGAVSATGAVMMTMTPVRPITLLPNAFYVRTGGTNWRDYIPLLTANTSTNVLGWGPNAQFYDINIGVVDEIAKQFSYFAGYWLNFNKASNGQIYSVPSFNLSGSIGTFTFTATSTNPVTTYNGLLSGYNSTTYTLTPQTDGINAGIAASLSTALLRSTDFGNTFTEIPNTTLTGSTYWRAIAITNSAAVQTALAHGSTIYRSADYGSTWNTTAAVDIVGILTTEFSSVASPTYAWKSIAMSSDAKYQTGVVGGSGRIYVNSNYGREAWTAVDSSRNWAFVAMSADGRYQSAVVTSGAIYYNSNFGIGSWTAVTSPTGLTWTGIAVSSADGKYQTAVASGPENIRVNSNFGVGTWVSKEVARNWSGVAISSTGQYQTAIHNNGFIYIDASFGEAATWTPVLTDTPRAWASVAMSSTGQYQTAVVAGGRIYANNNYGASGAWVETDSNRAWISVAISGATGRYQTAVAQNAQIYTNATFGLGTWTAVDSSRNWVSVTVSSEGKYQSAAVATSGQVYFSRDYGSTWSTTAGLDIMGNRWQDVAVSAETGAVQVTCVSGGYLYVSSDTGANWVSTTVNIDGVAPQATNRGWQAVAVSANGQYGLACVNSTTASGYLYRSLDYGSSWVSSSVVIDGATPQTTNRPWQDVGMSANGKYQVACLNNATQTSFTSNIASAVSVMVAPPGAVATTYGTEWGLLGADIDGEAQDDQSGYSVALSADGTTLAIGARYANTPSGTSDVGHVRVYKYNSNKTVAQTNQSLPGFGPVGWDQLGADIDGEAQDDRSGFSVALSADGTTLAIGAPFANTPAGTDNVGHVRVYKYNANKTVAQTNQSLPGFGPIGWDRLGADIDGEAQNDQSGYSVALSADGTTLAIGALLANNPLGTNYVGHVRVYKYNPNKLAEVTDQSLSNFGPVGWDRLGRDIDGEAANDQSGYSVALSADGTTVAIGAPYANTPAGTNDVGHVRVYKYNPTKLTEVTDQSLSNFGPVGWDRLGRDIDGEALDDRCGSSVALSADGTTVAIGAINANTPAGTTQVGHVRVYKYNANKTVAQTNQSLPGFGPVGWDQLGADIDGEAQYDRSGFSVALSADGTTLAIGARYADPPAGTSDVGHVRVYKYNPNKLAEVTDQTSTSFGPIGWNRIGPDIDGEAVGDQSGYSVALSADGTTVAIGAPYANNPAGTSDVGHVRVYKLALTNAITYTSSSSSVADIYGNLLLIKGANGTSNIVATQGATTTNGVLTVSGTTYTLVYTLGSVSTTSFIYYSKNYGASWTSLSAAGSRAWSSVALSENGGTISATTGDSTGGVWVYAMPDDQYYRSPALTNVGSTTTPATVRAIAYGNSGTGAPVDGYWVAGADASANSLAYSSNGVDWTAVVGSKTTLFNSVNGVAYGADTAGTPLWVAVGTPFIGSVPGSTAFSIAYSYNMTTWVGVRNAANFTGQGNHVAYGQDEFGAGVWVAVGQSDGVLAANLGDSALYNSNGTAGTTIFYSYDGANWAAGTGLGIFAVSGTDVTWGVDASGVGTWVATGIGYTDPLTGVVLTGGQVAHSTNGRVWTPIRALTAIVPAMTPTTLTTRGSAILPPPASSGVLAPVYGNTWGQMGADILGTQAYEQSGYSVSLSADGTIVAIGSRFYDVIGAYAEGRTRIYKYNGTSWGQLGLDISGTQRDEYSGSSVSLSADGTVVAIGSYAYDKAGGTTNANTDEGRTRVYKYNGISWGQMGLDISGTQVNENSGWSVSLSADGMTVAIGSYVYDNAGADEGRTRIYKYNGTSWGQLGLDISGTQVSENSGFSVSLSADGTVVAIGSLYYDKAGGTTNANTDEGRTRIYKYNGASWGQLGLDISGNQVNESCGNSVSLSADGTTVAIGSYTYDNANTDEGRTRIYKYNGASWGQLGLDISGNQVNEQSGWSVSLSADGTTVAIGSRYYDKAGGPTNTGTSEGRTRIYKYNGSSWVQLSLDIPGSQTSEYSGASVSLSADGTTVAVGSYVYDKDGGPTNTGTEEGRTRIYKIDTFGNVTYSISNPAIADIYANTILSIKEGASGSATITAVQPATPPFTAVPVTVQGTLTVTGTVYTLVYNNVITTFTPFPGAVAGDSPCVAYGRAGSQGAGAPLWIVANGSATSGSGGTNVFAMSSAPTTTGAWSVVASNAPATNAPFPTCNSIGYSNGVWVAANNTDASNILARSTDGGSTWTPVTASSISGILTGAAAIGANAFCNYSLAYADYSNDTNLRSWVAVQGTKNFFFEGGVNTVATVTPDVSASVYNIGGTRAWWVAGGVGLDGVASIGTTTDPSGATGWTKATSPAIANLSTINAVAFSPHTQRWLAVGAGAAGSLGANVLTSSDATGTTWTAGAVTSALTPVITLNTCIWNQAPASASAAGRWLAGGTRNGGVGADSACVYISTDASGEAIPWTPVTGTGAILSQVYSLAFNGLVWIAAGAPATDNGSTSTLMRTADPAGATGWHSLPATNASTGGFDTAARSITWNADQQMWVATGENTGSAADASFSSIIYSRDVNGAAGTWRTVRESNSVCFSGEGTGIAFTGDKWFAAGDNGSGSGSGSGSAIVVTTGVNASNATTASWTPVTHGTALTRASDIAYTGRRLVATGTGTGAASGIIYSSNGTGDNGTWTSSPAGPFNDASGGGTSVTFEASYEGTGRLVATGRSATNALSVSTDGGVSWNTPAAPSVQYSSTNTFDTTTTPLFTTGGNSVAYVGNDTLFAGGGNDVHWTGKRWVAVGKNSAAAAAASAVSTASAPDVVNNNTIPIATSDDGITWQCVRTSQAPNLTEGAFIGTNSRIGATPLINSQITISDGGDTEGNSDYGGSGTGVAQIDIIAELTPVSNAAASVVGTVGILGAAGNGIVGHVTTPSFDNTAFTITTRPM
jgi:hypothetical protein